MAGLYFHIPYCRQVCSYCNFHFSTSTRGIADMVTAMENELRARKDYMGSRKLETVYFGGGTPSLLDGEQIRHLMAVGRELFQITADDEITLEANPEDILPEKLEAWKNAGINRLSIGIQSLNTEDLKYMNRNHSARQARESIELAKQAGFPSLNVDLIFGSPWLRDENWIENLDWAFSCGADHISAYALTVEPRTFLNRKVQKGEWPNVEEAVQAGQYKVLHQRAMEEGWDFYEISNLSKPGHRAVHNSNYWKNLPYLGIGPSAHSFAGNSRQWNVSDNRKYIESWLKHTPCSEQECLSPADMYNEYLLTNIRTAEGVSVSKLESYDLKSATEIHDELQGMLNRGLIELSSDSAILTLEGRLLADWITSQLMC